MGQTNTSAYAMSHLPSDVVDGRTRFSISGRSPLSDVVRSRRAVWLQNKGELHAQPIYTMTKIG